MGFDDDANWEQVDEIQTLSGNHLHRKCMHMWGQRLCLCQFMAFMDNRKFQCQPRNDQFVYNPRGPSMSQTAMNEQQQITEQMDMEKEQKDIDKAVDAEKKKEKAKIVKLNKHYLDARHKEVKQAKLAEKEKQKIKSLQKDISKIKKEKPAMSKKKRNVVKDKALSKMTKKEKKKE